MCGKMCIRQEGLQWMCIALPIFFMMNNRNIKIRLRIKSIEGEGISTFLLDILPFIGRGTSGTSIVD